MIHILQHLIKIDMKNYKILLSIILILLFCNFYASAQKKEGDIERMLGNYKKAVTYYLNENLSSYTALCLSQCYSMTGQTDSAFYYLNFVIDQEKENIPVSSYEGIKEFESLKKYSEWNKLMEKCIQFQTAYEAKLNIPLRDTILKMRKIDNNYQGKFDSIMLTNNSIAIQSFKNEWKTSVKENDLRLLKIIDTYGWPTKELVGDIASSEVFFIVQHSSNLELQKKSLSLLKQIANNDKNDLIPIAYLEDRILVKSGEKQLYGTQYNKDRLFPIQDPENLNRRRAQIGLDPVQIIQKKYEHQNLIPNYGFELYSKSKCPKFLREIDSEWGKVGGESFSITDGDTTTLQSRNFIHLYKDQHYFNSCTGNAYIRYYLKDFNSVKPELFQIEMKDTLIKGEEYLIEYYTRIESRYKSGVTNKNDICIFLLKNKYHFKIKGYSPERNSIIKGNFKIRPDIFFNENSPVEEFSEWTKVTNKFIAKGGEKYFLIGSYGYIKNNYTINIDNITVQRISNKKINIENAKIGEAIVLENISFELNSSKLTDSSYPTLNQLTELFNTYPNLKIEIAGHTDNTGNKDDNIKLSESRAKTVLDFLISAGVKSNRVQAKGYGDSFPISDNMTVEGKKKNRRVEFKILHR